MKNWPRHELLPYAIIGVVLLLGGFALTVVLILFTGRANWSYSGTVPLLLTLLLAASVVGLTGIPFVATALGDQCSRRGWLMIFGSTAAVFIGSIVTEWTVFATPIAMVFSASRARFRRSG